MNVAFRVRSNSLMTLFVVSRLNDGGNIVSLRINLIVLYAEDEIWLAVVRWSTVKH